MISLSDLIMRGTITISQANSKKDSFGVTKDRYVTSTPEPQFFGMNICKTINCVSVCWEMSLSFIWIIFCLQTDGIWITLIYPASVNWKLTAIQEWVMRYDWFPIFFSSILPTWFVNCWLFLGWCWSWKNFRLWNVWLYSFSIRHQFPRLRTY